jgi:hypothetical protein
MLQESMRWPSDSKVALQFLVDVDEARRRANPVGDRETQAVGLTGTMVGILADDHDPHVIKRRQVERPEPVGAGWKDSLPRIALRQQELLQLGHVRLVEFRLKRGEPAGVKLYLAHTVVIASAGGAWQSSK